MADNEETVRLSNTPNSRSSHSSEETPLAHVDSSSGSQTLSPRKVFAGYQCKLCTLVASSQAALDEHMNIHTGSRPYQCLECGFSCSLQSTLQQHLAVHRVEMSSSVLMRSPTMEDMQKSPREHAPTLFPEIPKNFSGPAQLLHPEDIIPVPPPMGVFDQTRVFQCKLCTHISPTKTHLNEHMNIHSGKKPYKCLVCGFSSAFRSSLMRHLIVHTGTSKQFKCDQCHYQTPYKCNLQAHKRKRHNSQETMETSFSDSVQVSSGSEGTKIPTPALHSDESQNGISYPNPGHMSSPFAYMKRPPSISGNEQASPGSDIAGDIQHKDSQEHSTSEKSEHTTPMDENGYSDSTSNQPLQVSTTHESMKLSPDSRSPTGSNSEVDPSGGRSTEEISCSTPSSQPTSSGQNGNVDIVNVSSNLQGEGSSSVTSSSLPLASLTQMAHSPLSQSSSLSDHMPVSQLPWSNRMFPIYPKRNRLNRRKRTPYPKRDVVASPERDFNMWVDTRMDPRALENQLPHQAPLYVDMTSRDSMKSDEDSNPDQRQNGLDLSSPSLVPREDAPSSEGLVNHQDSPVSIPPSSEEVEGYGVFPNSGQGMPLGKVTVATQTDYSLLIKAKIEGQADPSVSTEIIPPQAAKCPHCETYFTDNVMFTLHMSCHGRAHPFQCGICGYMCGDKIEFTCHITRSKHLR